MHMVRRDKSAFLCVKCGRPVEARNAAAYRLMMQGRPALCDDCRSEKNGKERYTEYLESSRWHMLASDCKAKAGNRCQICNSPDNLEAHHRTYERIGEELPGDLTCLCRTCHEIFTRNGRLNGGGRSTR